MLLNVMERNGQGYSFWNDLDRIQEELSRGSFSNGSFTRNYYNPPINVYVYKDYALISAIIPGYEPETIELSIIENKVQITGTQKPLEIQEEIEVHRQEIVHKNFQRTIELPFKVDTETVEAKFKNGILNVELPKAEADKPRKISVQLEN